MFNLKEKLNRFLDDLEEVEGEGTNKEETIIASPEDFNNKKEEMASYLQSLKEEKFEEVSLPEINTDPIDDFEPVTLAAPTVEVTPIEEPKLEVKTHIEPEKPIIIDSINRDLAATIITDDLVINGDIITNAPLQFAGTICGNIKSSNQVHIAGNVEGNIEASTAQIVASKVKGSITCDGNVVISDNSMVEGDIYNTSISIDGVINGSIYSKGKVIINGNAEIYGNVSAATIAIEEGAIVQGNVKINMGR